MICWGIFGIALATNKSGHIEHTGINHTDRYSTVRRTSKQDHVARVVCCSEIQNFSSITCSVGLFEYNERADCNLCK